MSSINKEKFNEITKVKARFQRCSARKARFVIDAIRGKSVTEARGILSLTHRPSAAPKILNLLKNAVDSVEKGHKYDGDVNDLVIGAVYADDGPMMKRIRPASFGRAFPIRKRFCHITMILAEDK